MSNLKIELKSIKTFEGMEGTGLNAYIYVNGTKCLQVIDEGNGGMIIYRDVIANTIKQQEKIESLIKKLDEHIKNHEPIKYEIGGKEHEMSYDRDLLVDELFNTYQLEKQYKKYTKNYILVGKRGENKFTTIKLKMPLKDIPTLLLEQTIKKIKKEYCKNGEEILNTNLKELGVSI